MSEKTFRLHLGAKVSWSSSSDRDPSTTGEVPVARPRRNLWDRVAAVLRLLGLMGTAVSTAFIVEIPSGAVNVWWLGGAITAASIVALAPMVRGLARRTADEACADAEANDTCA
jgi:hypothetical protein